MLLNTGATRPAKSGTCRLLTRVSKYRRRPDGCTKSGLTDISLNHQAWHKDSRLARGADKTTHRPTLRGLRLPEADWSHPSGSLFAPMTTTLANPSADANHRRGRFIATVLANEPLCREHNRLVLAAPGFPTSQPGQFVQVRCRDVDKSPLGDVPEREWAWHEAQMAVAAPSSQPDLLRPTPIIRRPFSIAGRRSTAGGDAIELINRDVGPGTRWLFNLRVGQEVDIIGPLGNAFTFPAPGETAVLVGGGVGIPPMLYLAQGLSEANGAAGAQQKHVAVAFCGAMSLDLLPLKLIEPTEGSSRRADPSRPARIVLEFAAFGFEAVISTDDGSYGFSGRVTEALVACLDSNEAPAKPVLYTCGPEPMMKAVAAIARKRNLRCEVAVERAMACGMGTCQSCVIRQVADNERGWRYRLACTDGPIFDASRLLW